MGRTCVSKPIGCVETTEAGDFPGASGAGRSVDMTGEPFATEGLIGGVVMQDIDPKIPRTKAAAIASLELMRES
jgi:hypothetical protein